MDKVAFNVTYECDVPVMTEDVVDTVVTAIEGGIGYWACLDNTGDEYKNAPEDECVSETVGRLLLEGKKIRFIDNEDDDEVWELDLGKLKNGFTLYAKEGYDAYGMVSSKGLNMSYMDAEAADIIFQLALFGEVVYG